jgi:hypothetical protein
MGLPDERIGPGFWLCGYPAGIAYLETSFSTRIYSIQSSHTPMWLTRRPHRPTE